LKYVSKDKEGFDDEKWIPSSGNDDCESNLLIKIKMEFFLEVAGFREYEAKMMR